MFGSIGNASSGIGCSIVPNQVGGESFIRHIGSDKLIFDFKEGCGTTVRDKSHSGNDGVFETTPTKTSQYPPEQSDTYVKATSKYSTNYWAYFTTDPAKPLVGGASGNIWVVGAITNQRFHIDLGSAKVVTRIYYENYHTIGLNTNRGVQNFTFWGSNIGAGSFDDLVYTNDTGWTELTVSQNTFDEHIAADQADPKYITVTNAVPYRYYAFKFADNYGGVNLGVRRIELQIDTYPSHPTWKRNSLYFDGGDYVNCGQDSSLNFIPQTDEFTLEIVAKVTVNEGTLISKTGINDRQYQLFLAGTGQNYANVGGTATTGTGEVTNKMSNIVSTVDKTTVYLYVNGVFDKSGAIGSATNNKDVLIGARRHFTNEDVAYLITGFIYCARIYSKCLSGIEAQQEYLANRFNANN